MWWHLWYGLTYSSMWCEKRGVSYVVKFVWRELTRLSMYVLSYMWYKLCGAIYVVGANELIYVV